MKENKISDKKFPWLPFSIVLNVLFFICAYKDNKDDKNILSTIRRNSKDTIWVNDSAYVIKAKIDSIFYDPKTEYHPD